MKASRGLRGQDDSATTGTPGRRTYLGTGSLPKVKNGLGIAIISTSKGVLTDYECRAQRVGGEILCKVW